MTQEGYQVRIILPIKRGRGFRNVKLLVLCVCGGGCVCVLLSVNVTSCDVSVGSAYVMEMLNVFLHRQDMSFLYRLLYQTGLSSRMPQSRFVTSAVTCIVSLLSLRNEASCSLPCL